MASLPMFHSELRLNYQFLVRVAVGWSPYLFMRVYQFVGKNQEKILGRCLLGEKGGQDDPWSGSGKIKKL